MPEADYLEAIVTDRGRIKPTVTLQLPSESTCIRLLRDPISVRAAQPLRTPAHNAPTSNLIFTPSGRKLMARSGSDHLVVYPFPNSPNGAAGKPKTYHTTPPRPILAAGNFGQSIVLVTQVGDLKPLQSSIEGKVVGVVVLKGDGIISTYAQGYDPGLIILKPDRRRITVMGENWVRSVPAASAPIVQFTASPYGPEIDYLTERGELVVYYLQQEAVLCRFLTGAIS